MNVAPVTLTHGRTRLEPLAMRHEADLATLVAEEDLWRFVSTGGLAEPGKLTVWMQNRIREAESGDGQTWAIIDSQTERGAGCSSIFDVSAQHRHVEIGRTWLGVPYQRTALNTEAKYLLLSYCFDTLGCVRVQLKTDARNVRSQKAIERLGAVHEGVLRAHMILPDGFIRDTVMYSITAQEWPAVRANLETKMATYAAEH